MAKALIILNQHGFHEDEVTTVRKTLERSGHAVKIASATRTRAVSSGGADFVPDFAFHEINPGFFDAVIVIGEGARELSANSHAISLVRSAALRGKIVAGITGGPLVLAAAGVLAGRRATVCPEAGAVRELKEANARYERKHVVCDGNIITADDPESSEEFAREIIKILG